ncbi:MAG TPA: lipopolysaccharide kinase InaA family protein [Longimicrobiales bacterium]|nr:lipopolysaccharide kinase InaA family protein [Longimicrobiales bacterium]
MIPTMQETQDDLPAPYRREIIDDVELIALPEALDAARQALSLSGSLFDFAASRPGARALAGRGVAYHIPAPGSYTNERWMVRHYRRGGFIARFVRDRYLDSGVKRPIRELTASVKARARGVATPEVVAAAVYPAGGWYRADIVTRFLPESRDLADRLFDDAAAERRRQAMRLAGGLLRRAHEAGVVHNDLNLGNILIAGPRDAERAWLLDLDRAVVMRDAAARFERDLMLRRFARSLRKFERAHRTKLKAGEREAFAQAYALDSATEGTQPVDADAKGAGS